LIFTAKKTLPQAGKPDKKGEGGNQLEAIPIWFLKKELVRRKGRSA